MGNIELMLDGSCPSIRFMDKLRYWKNSQVRHTGANDPVSKLFPRFSLTSAVSFVNNQLGMFPVKWLSDKSSTFKWCCVCKKYGSERVLLSSSQLESTSRFNWNGGIHPGKLISTAKLGLPEKSISSSFVRFLSQINGNVPLKLFWEKRMFLSDKERFEDMLIGIGPSKRFADRSNSSIWGSENKNVGRLPLNWLELRYNSRRFCKFPNAAKTVDIILFIIFTGTSGRKWLLFCTSFTPKTKWSTHPIVLEI